MTVKKTSSYSTHVNIKLTIKELRRYIEEYLIELGKGPYLSEYTLLTEPGIINLSTIVLSMIYGKPVLMLTEVKIKPCSECKRVLAMFPHLSRGQTQFIKLDAIVLPPYDVSTVLKFPGKSCYLMPAPFVLEAKRFRTLLDTERYRDKGAKILRQVVTHLVLSHGELPYIIVTGASRDHVNKLLSILDSLVIDILEAVDLIARKTNLDPRPPSLGYMVLSGDLFLKPPIQLEVQAKLYYRSDRTSCTMKTFKSISILVHGSQHPHTIRLLEILEGPANTRRTIVAGGFQALKPLVTWCIARVEAT